MSSTPTAIPIPTSTVPPLARRGWFLVTVFTSAFLLFLVQPMIARMALPRVGGAPSVWNSAMLVYQGLLLAGYAYAHFLGRLGPRKQALVHLALLGLAALTLPIALIDAVPSATANSFLWVPWLLLVSIGPLFFIVSAQAPLLQRWYAVAGHGDPYPLYAASNFGSFLGLLAYPLIVELLFPVAAQSLGWSAGFVLLGLLVAGCALMVPAGPALRSEEAAAPATPGPTRREVAKWIGLAAIPSGLIMSTTLHLTTDIVAMPLLWVVPLGLYLLSFTFAFAEDRRAANLITRFTPLALLLTAGSVCSNASDYPLLMLAVALVGLFMISVALHARLFDRRPDPSHLTGFYLAMSVGGAVGGLFCALAAPLLFDWTYEHPILIIAAAAVVGTTRTLPGFAEMWDGPSRARKLRIAAIVLLVALIVGGWSSGLQATMLAGLSLALIVGVIAAGQRWLFVAAVAVAMLVAGGFEKLALSAQPGMMTRSFFGIYSIREKPDVRMLVHGTTTHGFQNLGSPAREVMPISYYAPRSGVGLAMRALPAARPGARVGIVGLGAGTLACYAQPGQSWSFFEIDPVIVRIARDDGQFHFLSRCKPDARMVVGDARLTLGREAAGSMDLLVIDAFSSDSVPMHLLTREAFAGYRRILAPDGLLMVHISNRYLELEPVIAAAAAHGWQAMGRFYRPTEAEKADHDLPSQWIALSPSPATLARLRSSSAGEEWRPLATRPGFAGWTDDHSTILPLIKWGA